MPMALARTPLPKAVPPLVTWPPPPGASGYLWPVMMKRTTRALLSGALAIGLFGGCSSDLDVTAPYEQITVVYGLLDRNDNLHWVKINKAFLGDGDAYQYASIPDSTEYRDEELSGFVANVEADGSPGGEQYPLRDTIVDRVPGLFAYPQHKMYCFNANLNEDTRYGVFLNVKGKTVRAYTNLVNDFLVQSATGNLNTAINFVIGGSYVPYSPKWFTGDNGKRYEVSFRFHYDEVKADGTTELNKTFTSLIGTQVTSGAGGDLLEVSLNGELFYQAVRSNIPPAAESGVTCRYFRGIDLLWAVAGPDLHTYLLLANPISGIVEERPDYSNIEGGFGLFSSRLFKMVGSDSGDQNTRKALGPASLDELVSGQYTGDRGFCY